MNSTASRLHTKHLYYPLFLDISDKLCTILGGGRIAERKVMMLLKFNAKVRLISPKITRNLAKLSESGKIECVEREYKDGDLEGALLVFAATNRKEINVKIKREAAKRDIPVNVVDDPVLCDFIVPSIVKKAPIIIAISTSGTLPLLSKKLRKEISNYITRDYIRYAQIIGKFRKYLVKNLKNKEKRREIMAEIDKTDFKELAGMDINEIKNRFMKESQ